MITGAAHHADQRGAIRTSGIPRLRAEDGRTLWKEINLKHESVSRLYSVFRVYIQINQLKIILIDFIVCTEAVGSNTEKPP